MPRTLKYRDCQVLDADVARKRYAAEVVGDRIVEVDGSASFGTRHHALDLRHLWEPGKPSGLDRNDDRRRVDVATGDLASAFDGMDTEVDAQVTATDHGAGGEKRLVARAQHDGAGQARLLEGGSHGIACGLTHLLGIALPQEGSARQRRRLRCVD